MSRPTRGRLARYGFAEGDGGPRAADLLGADGLGLWLADEQEPVDRAAADLLAALSRAADPDLALRQLHRMMETERRTATATGSGVLAALAADPGLRRRLVAVLGASSALGDHLVANPGQWTVLGTAPDGLAPTADGRLDLALAGRLTTATAPVAVLRQAYRLALLRIAAADLTGGRGLEQVMSALSALADATLAAAYEIAVGELPAGTPRPRLAVVAMGKCGGGELNYVSDVDVIFVAATDEDLPAATTVAARLIHVCGLVAWPVDAALRPEGNRGPLVRTLASHLAYYQRWARTWEFQALLKARPAAGDLALAGEWVDALAPLVWRASERPEAVSDVRAMRRRIIDNIPPKELDREIKRGPGGLRDIEFAVQLLQLVHGRGDESLRVPGTVPALRALVTGGYVGRADGEALLRGYRFLRGVEHRLQLQALRRTHTVPTEPAALRWLAAALGYAAIPGRSAVESFRVDWVAHATEVRRLHAKLLYRPLLESVARVPADGLRLTPEAARHRLEILGFADPAGALRHLQALTGGVSRTAAIQRTLLPVLLSEFADAPEPDRGCSTTARSPTSSAAPRGTSDCCATPARWPAGWPGCCRRPGTRPTCWPGNRRRCGCWPRRTSWHPGPGRCSATGSPPPPPGTPTRSRRPGRSARCAAGNSSGSPAPTCSAGPVGWPRDPSAAHRPVRWPTSPGSAPGCPTSPTPPSPPRCRPSGPPSRSCPACGSR